MSNVPSYVCGVSDTPLLGDTIGQALARAAARWPDRPALISPSHGVSWTWRELHERVQALAAGFLALGLQRGDRIGVWSLNRPDWTLTQFAAAEAGLAAGRQVRTVAARLVFAASWVIANLLLSFFAGTLLDAVDAMLILYAVDRDHMRVSRNGEELHQLLSGMQARRPLYIDTYIHTYIYIHTYKYIYI